MVECVDRCFVRRERPCHLALTVEKPLLRPDTVEPPTQALEVVLAKSISVPCARLRVVHRPVVGGLDREHHPLLCQELLAARGEGTEHRFVRPVVECGGASDDRARVSGGLAFAVSGLGHGTCQSSFLSN